jgi:sugar phosphate isomerase/epimerase
VSDYVLGTTCLGDRAVLGDGDVPLPRLINDALEAGYQGLFELEVNGPRIEEEGYRSALVRNIDYLDTLLSKLGA